MASAPLKRRNAGALMVFFVVLGITMLLQESFL